MKPFIGITASYETREGRYFLPVAYVKAVLAGGGIPIILPSEPTAGIPSYLKALHGILLSGGVDIEPYFFGAEPSPFLGEITPERDWFEISLVRNALPLKIPILGICRGAQVLNVAFGGTLCQHIQTKGRHSIKHSQSAPRWHCTHSITIQDGTKLGEMIGAGPHRVNSFHHQSIQHVAEGFHVVAKSKDGVIEAIEGRIDHPFLIGVQWHPECMIENDEGALALFRKFVETCNGPKKQKKSGK